MFFFKVQLDDMQEILKEAKAKVLIRLQEKRQKDRQQHSLLPTVTEDNINNK